MKAVHQIFESKVKTQPESLAIANVSAMVSYKALNEQANILAHLLIQLGVQTDVFVGILMPSGYHFLSALLAVFKSNGVYMPLDWNFSEKRFKQIFKNSFSGILIISERHLTQTQNMLKQFNADLRYLVVLGDEKVDVYDGDGKNVRMKNASRENPDLEPEMYANNYIYYTSGSTGEGKAIVGNHAALSHYINWEIKEFNIDHTCRVSQIAQITFDASLKDIFTALCAGGTLCIPTQEEKENLSILTQWIEKLNISLLQCVPSIFRLITNELKHTSKPRKSVFPNLKQVILAGEMLYAKDLINWKSVVGSHVAIANLYGATESTILKTFHKIQEVPANPAQSIHVGKPIDDTSVAIINDNHICRPGEKGEIYIKTPYLTNGYYQNEALNKLTFVQNPLTTKPDIVYKTGDVGRYLKSGDIEVLGRIDDQVKVNGIRIELGEIEGAMMAIPGIDKAVVIPYKKSPDQTDLVGYYSNSEISIDEIRKALGQTLNAELVPSYLINIEEFPLNINGKVNKRLLPKPETFLNNVDASEQPVGPTENKLLEIWKEVLCREDIGRTASFFHLGGNSIKALQITSHIYKQFSVNLKLTSIFENPSIASLANSIDEAGHDQYKPLVAIEEQEFYDLSYGQSRIWALLQLEDDAGAYNMHTAFEINGAFDQDAFESAFSLLVRKHESLRTFFIEIAGKPKMKILEPSGRMAVKVHDLKNMSETAERVRQMTVDNARRKFDLSKAPLFRLEIIQLSEQKFMLLLAIHHIIADGWSTEVLSQDLAALYHACVEGKTETQILSIQYKDFVAWQRHQLSEENLSKQARYWLTRFSGDIPVLHLPTDKSRPAMKTYNGARFKYIIEPLLSENINEYCAKNQISLYVFFLTAINHILHLYTGETDIVIGSPTSGRNHPDLENQIGFYLNNVALRITFSKDDTFRQLVDNVKATVNDAQQHNEYPFHLLIKKLGLERDQSRSLLYDIGFTWHEVAFRNEARNVNFELAKYDTPFVTAKADLWFHGMKTNNGIVFFIEYNTDLFYESWLDRFSMHFTNLVHETLQKDSLRVNTYNLLSLPESNQQLNDFAVGNKNQVNNTSFLSGFHLAAEKYPNDLAVEAADRSVTYDELNQTSNRLAVHILKEWNLTPGRLVAVMANRSIESVIAILAILKSGAAFLPIDVTMPKKRISLILEDADVAGIITESQFLLDLPETVCENIFALDIQLDELPACNDKAESFATDSDLAYVIYTSGSTGKPKGVAIQNKSFTNYLTWANMFYFNNKRGNIFAWFTSLSFDLTLTSIFTTLMRGDKLVICNQTDTDELLAYLFSDANDVNTIKLTPSHLGLLAYCSIHKTNIRTVIVGGEKLSRDQVDLLFNIDNEIALFNEYGPTECTVGCTVNRVKNTDDVESIGRPIHNMSVYVLDGDMKLLPVGCTGEICVSGEGVSQGYLHNEELTRQKFISHPFVSNKVLYRTGDKGKWTAKGELIYQGRLDSQIKIKGYRIEPEEIEKLLQRHDAIEKVAVLLTAEGEREKCLTAFFTSPSDIIPDLKHYLLTHVPEYMVPTYFHRVDEFPLTRNGKLDTKKLKADFNNVKETIELVEPASVLQRRLKVIWENVLHRDKISIRDSFFKLGGESLKAIQLVYHIDKELNVKLRPSDIFTYPTIEQLAVEVQRSHQGNFTDLSSMCVEEQDHYPVSHSQKRLWYFDRMNTVNKNAYHIPTIHHFKGDFNVDNFAAAVHHVVERHESLRTVFVNVDDQPRQKIIPTEKLHVGLPFTDLSQENSRSEVIFDDIRKSIENEPFDLSEGPLFRFHILKISNDEFRVLLTIHHIISDEWSFELLGKEVIARYSNLREKVPVCIEKLKFHYKDFSIWQNEAVHNEEMEHHRQYWLSRFQLKPALIDFPFAKLRPKVKTFSGERINFNLDKKLVQSIKAYCNREGVSTFMFLLGALKTLIYRYTSEPDIVLSTPTIGRDRADLEDQIGNFINMLPIRSSVNGHCSFEVFLRDLRATMLEAYDHQTYPFDCLLEELNLETDFSRQPLFDVGFTWHTTDMVNMLQTELNDLTVEQSASNFVMSKADMWWHAMDAGELVGFSLVYSIDLFYEKDILNFVNHYKCLLANLVNNVHKPIAELTYLTDAENQSILSLGRNVQSFDELPSIVELFERNVQYNPDGIAIACDDRCYSYRELNNKVNQLSHILMDKYNVKPGDIVGVTVHRSEWIIISLLAIFKSGAVYLPSDPDNPKERLAYIFQHSHAKVLITQSELLIEVMDFFHSNLVLVDMELSNELGNLSNPGIRVNEQQPAYVIYTSGTTGQPKGVMATHGGLMNLLKGLRETFDYSDVNSFGLVASISFDASLKQLLQPLMLGKRLVILNNIRNIKRMANTICLEKINIISITPTVLQAVMAEMISKGTANALRIICCGGEALSPVLCNQLMEYFPQAQLYNIYGPTETTDLATFYAIRSRQSGFVPIGRPLPNCEVYVLDKALQLLPVGVKGEIFIGGRGVSLGYIHDTAKTSEKFIDNPYQPGERLYRTSDIGFFGDDGNLRIVGRMDNQVKVRGHRVELEEIQNLLAKHPHVKQCAVTTIGEGAEKEIVAYVVNKPMITVTPSWAEQFVYDDMAYYAMSNDHYRMERYREALSKAVQDKVVLEIGPGADAVLSLMSIECGARKVYAVEILEESYNKAKRKIEMLGWSNKIELIHGDVTKISLPEKVDCCIADIIGSIGGSQGAAKIINESRRLMKDSAMVIPGRSVSKIAAITLPDDLFDYSFDEVGAHYAKKIFKKVSYPFDIRLSLKNFKSDCLISTRDDFEDLDYQTENELESINTIGLNITKSAMMNGFVVWLHLMVDNEIAIDTLKNNEQKLWLPVYLPVFPEGVSVERNDFIKATVRRTVSKNSVNPDYLIEGTLFRGDKPSVTFSYNSFNEDKLVGSNGFYKKLFNLENNQDHTNEIDTNFRIYTGLSHNAVVSYLTPFLPHYMLPSRTITMDEIPVTNHGKIDYSSLPTPDDTNREEVAITPKPATQTEERLLYIWKEVLKREHISLYDSFFSIGGHSLRAAQMISRIHAEFSVELDLKDVFDNPTVTEMASKIKQMGKANFAYISAIEEQDHYKVSHAQKRLWLLHQADENMIAFNNPITLELRGDFSETAFNQALRALIERHEVLRSTFVTVAGEPRQRVISAKDTDFTEELITSVNQTEDVYINNMVKSFIERPFDLREGPLMKAEVLRLSNDRHILMFSIHHIISDAWSLSIIMDELIENYNTFLQGNKPAVQPLNIQYKDFTAWHGQQLLADNQHKQYWLSQFSEIPERLELPYDFSASRVNRFSGGNVTFMFEDHLSVRLKQFSVNNGGSLFVTLTAMVTALLYKYTGQTTIVVGTNVAGRDHRDLENQIGFYLNTIPIIITIDEHASFSALHDYVNNQVLGAFDHQIYPYDMLISDLNEKGADAGQPLFNVEVELINVNMGNQSNAGLHQIAVKNFSNGFSVSKDDLSFRFIEDNNTITLNIVYRSDLFERHTIERMIQHYKYLTTSILEQPNTPVADIDYLSAVEREHLATAFDTVD